MLSDTYNLYPEIEPFHAGWYESLYLHKIYYEECGNPDGQPVVFLHGGPGSGCNPAQRRFFDPAYYRIILLDQRGCGRSTPLGSVEQNTTEHLVADIEGLRAKLNIDRWLVFGGSWGSTLGLAYALAYPERVTGLILRGIFLSRSSELVWFLNEVRHFYPEAWDKLLAFIPADEQDDIVGAYVKRIFSNDPAINAPAATHWNAYESSIMTLRPSTSTGSSVSDDIQVARARVQLHYIVNECFIDGSDMLQKASKLSHIATIIVQGRYDMVCPPITAWDLKKTMPHAELHMVVDAGHSAMESGTTSALVAATEQFKSLSLK
ncbi:MAG TPA: prolyl aminopeptidase [Methylophilaceae bacterium]|nr:prolyl aminopeptidase [Methylotenera sp.]HSH71939.1 prolyl aminopeptidase [Methylophilaceae bacterium]